MGKIPVVPVTDARELIRVSFLVLVRPRSGSLVTYLPKPRPYTTECNVRACNRQCLRCCAEKLSLIMNPSQEEGDPGGNERFDSVHAAFLAVACMHRLATPVN